jgi:hypothetical protein
VEYLAKSRGIVGENVGELEFLTWFRTTAGIGDLFVKDSRDGMLLLEELRRLRSRLC